MSALASTPAGAAILALYGHPFSSYTQKVLTALYENGTPFELRNLDPQRRTTMPPTGCAAGRLPSFRCWWMVTARWWKAAS